MVYVNLLPWREQSAVKSARLFVAGLIAGLLFLACVMGGIQAWVVSAKRHQLSRNAFLEKEIKQLDQQIKHLDELKEKRSELLKHIAALDALHTGSLRAARIFEALVHLVPPGAKLGLLSREGYQFMMGGAARSDKVVSKIMRSIDDSNLFLHATLQEVRQGEKEYAKYRIFQMSFFDKSFLDKPVEKAEDAHGMA